MKKIEMQIIDFSDRADLTRTQIQQALPRAALDATKALAQVLPLISEVKEQGSAALFAHAARFDGVTDHELRVSEQTIKNARDEADPALIAALEQMIERVRKASAAQVFPERTTEVVPGGKVVQRNQPVDRVGLYVPGGKAVYPSSVIMNAVAAQTAGVKSLAIASPVQTDSGSVHPTILAAASLLGVTEVYAIGGASAIAAFAYGVPEIGLEPVDVVTGPGNIFVAAAKRALQGTIGIDSEAGTTEILIIADATAKPAHVAADLLSQAEHDEAAASVLVTDSRQLIEDVQEELTVQMAKTQHRERAGKALAGPQSALIHVRDLEQAAVISNSYAPEHLSIQVADVSSVVSQITNAGAIFIGENTPVSLGDYLAGSNHVLPTGGTARFSAGLGAHTFLRPQQIVEYSHSALATARKHLNVIATAEGLPAHAAAVNVRFED